MRSYLSTSKNYFFDFASFMATWEQDIQAVTVIHTFNAPIIERDTKMCAKVVNDEKLVQKYCELFSVLNQINQEQIKLRESFELCADMDLRSNVDLIGLSSRCINSAVKSHDLAVQYENLLIGIVEVTNELAVQKNDELQI